MKTVIYFEILRRRKKIQTRIVLPLIIWTLLFLIFTILDRKVPVINSRFMMWPDVLKSFLGMPAWSRDLAMNIWHFLALFYPVFWCGMIMQEVSCSVAEEERLETIVYLQNAGVKRRDIWLGKGVVWALVSCLSLLLLILVQALELWIAGMLRYLPIMAEYYGVLYLVSLFYLILGLFVSSYGKSEENCLDAMWMLVLIPWLISRIPAVLQFISGIMVETGRQGAVQEMIAVWGNKLKPVSMICPLTWCWYSMEVAGVFVVAAIVIAVLLGGAGFSIYQARRC